MSSIAHIDLDDAGSSATYRTGVAAKLAGLPVETLRVWERRYQLSSPARSPRGQRLYSAEQVRRLSLLKQLVDQGHAIGTLAMLPLEQLQTMLGAQPSMAGPPLRAVALGPTLAPRLLAGGTGHGGSTGQDGFAGFMAGPDVHVIGARAHLEDAGSLPRHADVLIIEISELDADALAPIQRARDATETGAVVVLYRFCASSTIRTLRAQGCLVARVPAQLTELAPLCRSAVAGTNLAALAPAAAITFNEEALAKIMALRNPIACECPRHLAELLMMVGSFERYSAQCASRNDADAQLHLALEQAAGQARGILENAMGRLLQSEGMWPLAG
ncbi:MerR family transcriptional regulator [Achromobacter spanius]|uniref:HTH merR-type domain-containing protein n=1 Tax=Achromobacter spanius TaxID=217203 RepID=A0AAW3I8Q9_9BURK|nr:MerR family transcriptional regulator [Achromobacter spanius]KNE28698.1 hypothetical protein AFM18_05710 [Achromobacter spanius]